MIKIEIKVDAGPISSTYTSAVITCRAYRMVKTLAVKKFGEKTAAKDWRKNFGEC